MNRPQPVRALLFDLDGTLVDTEAHTDEAVRAVVARHGVEGFSLPRSETSGRTWLDVAQTIRARTGIGAPAAELAAALLEYWNGATASVREIPGAPAALRRAVRQRLKLAIVSSSPRSVIDRFIAGLGVDDCVPPGLRIGGDSVRNGKPDPEGLLLAARLLGVASGESLVFEDSRAGLLAARAAGMRSVFIRCCADDLPGNGALATVSYRDYREIPEGFWNSLAAGIVEQAVEPRA